MTPPNWVRSCQSKWISNFALTTSNTNEILPKEPNEVTDLVLMEEGARVQIPNKETYCDSRGECEPQVMKTHNRNHLR